MVCARGIRGLIPWSTQAIGGVKKPRGRELSQAGWTWRDQDASLESANWLRIQDGSDPLRPLVVAECRWRAKACRFLEDPHLRAQQLNDSQLGRGRAPTRNPGEQRLPARWGPKNQSAKRLRC